MAFSLFKKRKSDEVRIKLEADQFCSVIEEKQDDVTNKYCIIADANNYNLLYRDGRFLGTPQPFGGTIYPFSDDPRKMGSNGQKKAYRYASVVCLSKDFNLKVDWGTAHPFLIVDPVTQKPYEIGANGVFYVNIDPSDAARNADKFYSKCLTQRNADLFNTEALRDFLRDAFIMQIGAKIEQYITKSGKSLQNYVGLSPSEILSVSQEICPTLADIFDMYGLTVIQEVSSNSILRGLIVREVNRNI